MLIGFYPSMVTMMKFKLGYYIKIYTLPITFIGLAIGGNCQKFSGK